MRRRPVQRVDAAGRARSRSSTPSIAGADHRRRCTGRAARVARRPRRPTADRPVLVFGHHHVWNPESSERPDDYFGINPDDSERLVELVGAPPGDRRLLRRPHPPQPGAPLRRHRRRAVGRGGVREGLPGRVGRVPRVRGRHPPGPSAASRRPRRWRGPRGPAHDVRRRCTSSYAFGDARATAASPIRPAAMTASDGRRRPPVRSPTCGSSTCARCSPGRGAPATSPTSAPTSSRSSGPAAATRTRGDGLARPAPTTSRSVEARRPRQALRRARPQGPPTASTPARARATTADVLVENFRPGTLERLGLGPDELHRRATRGSSSPRVTGFGQDGPYAAAPGFATIAEAMSGFAAHQRRARRRPAAAAHRAHRRGHRARRPRSPRWSPLHSGVGQVVDVNLLESMFQLMGPLVVAYAAAPATCSPGSGRASPTRCPAARTGAPTAGGWPVSTSAESVARRVMELIGARRRRALRRPSPAGSTHRDEIDALHGRRGSAERARWPRCSPPSRRPTPRSRPSTRWPTSPPTRTTAARGAIVERRRRADAGPRRPPVGHARPHPLGRPPLGADRRRLPSSTTRASSVRTVETHETPGPR